MRGRVRGRGERRVGGEVEFGYPPNAIRRSQLGGVYKETG